MSLDYYRKERERHPSLQAARCSFNDAAEAIRLLAKEYEVEIRDVLRTSGVRRSMWHSGSAKVIVFNVDHLSWLTVVHEFAHAWDEKTRPKSARWHDSEHAELVDILARKVVERGWIAELPAQRAARDLARLEARRARAAMANDPAVVRAKKIEKRRAQVERLEAGIKRCMVREAALTTRLKRAKRSLAALVRAAGAKEVVT